MMQYNHRYHIPFYERVDQSVVIVHPLLGHLVYEASGQQARPRDGEAVEVHPQSVQHAHIRLVQVVGVAGPVGVSSVLDRRR